MALKNALEIGLAITCMGRSVSSVFLGAVEVGDITRMMMFM